MYVQLPKKIVNVIQSEVDTIKETYHIVNPIVRNDIFNILEELCVVLRYPLENDEEANGIHVERWVKGKRKHFVFINTSNSMEKQVYTAAHELGHVWEIDKKVLAKIDEDADSEVIINRFAAELLMPEDYFKRFMNMKCMQLGIKEGGVELSEILKVVVYLMDVFMVPYKAVIYRFAEIGAIDEDGREMLEILEKEQPERIDETIASGNYQNLHQINPQKSMGDLYDMLIKAEQQEVYSKRKIEHIRNEFGFKLPMGDDKKEDTGSLQIILGD